MNRTTRRCRRSPPPETGGVRRGRGAGSWAYRNPRGVRRGREAGEPAVPPKDDLFAALAREGLSTVDAGRGTKNVGIDGRQTRVLLLRRPAVDALLGEEFPVTG